MSIKLTKVLVTSTMLLLGGTAAQAAICTAGSLLTSPDATVTNATSCGVGILNDNNDEAADLSTLLVGGFNTWAQIAKVNAPGSSNNGLSTTGTNPAGSSGNWAFDDLAAYDTYALVIKDGGAPGGNLDSIFWTWFVVDTAAGCSISTLSSNDYCGLWSMYGDNGKIKDISHIQLYGVNSTGGGTTGGGTTGGGTTGGGTTGGGTTGGGTTGGGSTGGGNVPEPGSIGLVGLGLGLLATGFISRRRRQAQAGAV